MIIKPAYSYGIELWGCASKSNVVLLQRTQFKLLQIQFSGNAKNQIIRSEFCTPTTAYSG